jgi:hypothetical protein
VAQPAVTTRPKALRRRYLIDKPTQLRIVLILLSALAAIALAFVGALYFCFVPDVTISLSGTQVRDLLFQMNWLFWGLAVAVVSELVVVLTHRFVGPGYVMSTALEGMLEGDYTRRLSTRKKDYLKTLTSRLTQVRDRWVVREAQVTRDLDRLERAVAAGDADAVGAAIAALRAGSVVRLPPAFAEDAGPSPARPADPTPSRRREMAARA